MPYAALRELLAITGLSDPGRELVKITGCDPVVPTRYKVGTAEFGRDAGPGFYPVRDGGWIHLQALYPHFREAIFDTVGGPRDLREAPKKTAAWDGVELEDAIHAAGGVAGLVRSPAEWAKH